MVALEVLF
jgi:hypothetical protein